MAFIHKYSTISKGNTFNQGIIDGCINSKIATDITHPDYKDVITGINLRRMSVIVKMGLANTINCSTRNKIDAIVVATGLASLHNSELFLCSLIDPEQSIYHLHLLLTQFIILSQGKLHYIHRIRVIVLLILKEVCHLKERY